MGCYFSATGLRQLFLDKNKTDIPLECYLRFGESLSDGVNRLLTNAFHMPKKYKAGVQYCLSL